MDVPLVFGDRCCIHGTEHQRIYEVADLCVCVCVSARITDFSLQQDESVNVLRSPEQTRSKKMQIPSFLQEHACLQCFTALVGKYPSDAFVLKVDLFLLKLNKLSDRIWS